MTKLDRIFDVLEPVLIVLLAVSLFVQKTDIRRLQASVKDLTARIERLEGARR